MPTKDELERENAELRDRVAELEAAGPADDGRGQEAPKPERPPYGLSAGEKADLESNGVTISPFTGETLTASREGVKPLTEEARRNDRRETARLKAAEQPPADGERQE